MSLVYQTEKFVKEALFDCRTCGQCILSHTRLICPMNCPKGLRNGPCGGTLDGKCEVLPEMDCVWTRIENKKGRKPPSGIHLPLKPELLNTASVVNLFEGTDRDTRLPQAFIDTRSLPAGSGLAAKMGRGDFVVTLEIASPRSVKGLGRVERILQAVGKHVDAVNTTTNAGGVPSLHSTETAKVVTAHGLEAILQFCGRDQGGDALIHEMENALNMGHKNFLLLTGDWLPDRERKNTQATWFPMDSSQMIHFANLHLEEWKERLGVVPFLGCAANPFSTPMSVSVDRLAFKRAAGARFCQTQAVTHVPTFLEWYRRVREGREHEPKLTIPSLPLIGSRYLFGVLCRLPGVYVDPVLHRILEQENFEEKCLEWAFGIAEGLAEAGAAGLHAMNFGMSPERMDAFLCQIRDRAREARCRAGVHVNPSLV